MTTETITCRGTTHKASNNAWRSGCRHPEAVQAHQEMLARERAARLKPAQTGPDGACTARRHGSVRAWEAGCRCSTSIEAIERKRRRVRDAQRLRRNGDYSREYGRERARVARLTGGRLSHDPRRKWRAGAMGVSRISLWFLVRGYCTKGATTGERLAAVAILDKQLTPGDSWFRKARPMNAADISRRTGMSEQALNRLTRKREQLREQRTMRRLADAQWKAAVAAEAAGRMKDRGRSEREHAAKEARRLFYARTRRRLQRSRTRAQHNRSEVPETIPASVG